jgi:hypothetical protein
LPATLVAKLWGAAILSAGLAWAARTAMPLSAPFWGSLCVLAVYGAGYVAFALTLRIEECEGLIRQVLDRVGLRRG